MIDPPTTYRLSKIIERIANDTFDESDIRRLLTEIRDYLPKDAIVRDIAHFIAHPRTKDRGLVHQDLSLFAYKIKRAVGVDKEPVKIKEISEGFYHMTIYGIGQLGKNIIINRIPHRTDEAVKMFKSNYKKNKQSFKLIEPITRRKLNALSDILKNVYNTIVVKPYITKSKLITMLNDAIACLVGDFSKDAIVRNSTDIMICLMSIIQNVNFILHDNSRAFLRWEPFSSKGKGEAVDDVSLFANCEGPGYVGFGFCFVSGECDPSRYGIEPYDKLHMKRQYYAERKADGKLILKLVGETMPFK